MFSISVNKEPLFLGVCKKEYRHHDFEKLHQTKKELNNRTLYCAHSLSSYQYSILRRRYFYISSLLSAAYLSAYDPV